MFVSKDKEKEEFNRLMDDSEFVASNNLNNTSAISRFFSDYFQEKGTPIHYNTIRNWVAQRNDGDFNLQNYLRGNLKDIAESLVHIIKTKKNTKSIEIALKTLGELLEKREDTVNINLNADFIARAFYGVKTELLNEGYPVMAGAGVGEVQGESHLLPPKLRED